MESSRTVARPVGVRAYDQRAIEGEVIGPNVLPGVKERDHLLRFRIDTRESWPDESPPSRLHRRT